MRRISLFLLLFLVTFSVVISGCNKNTDPAPAPPEEKEPIRIEKYINRYKVGDDIKVDTYSFKYDNEGRVTAQIYPENFEEQYTYTSGELTAVKTVGENGTMEVLNYSYYSQDGDTVLLDFTRPDQTGEGMDTVQLTYIFSDSNVVDYWTYLHFYSGHQQLQKEGFVYNSSGNLINTTFETALQPRSTNFTVLEWDDKLNPKHSQPKMNHMLLRAGLPLMSTSVHNPVKYTDGFQTFETEMTYNEEGYPLTVKFKHLDFVSTELIYNR